MCFSVPSAGDFFLTLFVVCVTRHSLYPYTDVYEKYTLRRRLRQGSVLFLGSYDDN